MLTLCLCALPSADFMVPPSQLGDEDETEDDISLSGSNYGFSFLQSSAPSSRSPSPDLSFMSEANAAAAAWKGDKPTALELHPQSSSTLPQKLSTSQAMRKSASYDLVAISRHRSRTMPSQEHTATQVVRKAAMSGDRKRDMEELRRRAIEKKRISDQRKSLSGDNQNTPAPTLSLDPIKMKRSRSNDLPVMSSRVSSTVNSAPHPHIKVVVATPPSSPDMRGEPRSVSPLTESMMAPEPTPKQPEPDIVTTSSSSPAGATSIENYKPPLSQHPDSTTSSSAEGKKRKPVPSPRKKQDSSDSEPLSSTTTAQIQNQHQISTNEPVEFKRIVTSNVEGRKYGTLEREKKPSAAPRKRTSSLDKERSREHRSGTLERKKRPIKTPEPQSSESSSTALPSKKISLGKSITDTSPPVVQHDIRRELESAHATPTQASVEASSHVKEKVEAPNPTLREIGKTTSVTSEGSVDSKGSAEGNREQVETVPQNDGGGVEDHKWLRKGAKRGGARHKRDHPLHQEEGAEDDEYSPRNRSRSGALSGGGRRAHMNTAEEEDEYSPRSRLRSGALSGGGKRAHTNTAEEEEQHISRSRTRSGAVSGNDAGVIRRSRNVKGSPRPSHRPRTRPLSGGSYSGKDGIDFPEPQFHNEPNSWEETEIMTRAQVSRERRVARTGGDLLVASDGEQD